MRESKDVNEKYLKARKKFFISLAVVILIPFVSYALRGISKFVVKMGENAKAEFASSLEGNGEIVDFSLVWKMDTKYIKDDGCFYSLYENAGKKELCILKDDTIPLVENTHYYYGYKNAYGYVMNTSDEFVDINDIYADWEQDAFMSSNGVGKLYNYAPEDLKHIVVYDIDKDIRYTPEEFKALFQGYFDAARYILFASVVVLCLEIPCIGIMLVFLGLFVSTNPDKKI